LNPCVVIPPLTRHGSPQIYLGVMVYCTGDTRSLSSPITHRPYRRVYVALISHLAHFSHLFRISPRNLYPIAYILYPPLCPSVFSVAYLFRSIAINAFVSAISNFFVPLSFPPKPRIHSLLPSASCLLPVFTIFQISFAPFPLDNPGNRISITPYPATTYHSYLLPSAPCLLPGCFPYRYFSG
jgi:hypothetical protein